MCIQKWICNLGVYQILLQKSCEKQFVRSLKTCKTRKINKLDKPHLSPNSKMARILHVAEKNDAAKNIANMLSNGTSRTSDTFSRYNKIYSFEGPMPGFNGNCKMIFTSVSGHILDMDFQGDYRNWLKCNPTQLFEAPVNIFCSDRCKDIERTLTGEAKNAKLLVIWTDCDREGERIGYEIIDICKKANPRIPVLRAKFSEITRRAVTNALNNLTQPDKRQSDAVMVRQELDLRIGAAFTRFQTMCLQRKISQVQGQVVSYGSCQFPTLGFVVERYKQIKNFSSSKFWYLNLMDERDGKKANFSWERNRLFDKRACLALYTKAMSNIQTKVIDIKSKRKTKYRPIPLDTIQMEKMASSYLKISAKRAMEVAEKLYQRGFISYPRTETNIFSNDIKFRQLIEQQTSNPNWGQYSQRLLNTPCVPRQGTKSDKAHPPIHPLKEAVGLQGDDAKVYELIVRHFLACLSLDAVGSEVSVKVDVSGEQFHLNGLNVIERNYLDVYIYHKWVDKEIPKYEIGEIFVPKSLTMDEGATTAPSLLSESDLISLMEKHGIGTDATHAEHIETIQKRMYARMTNDRRFMPKQLGLGLVDAYVEMGLLLSKPDLRAKLEKDLQAICEGTKNPSDVLYEQVMCYKSIFQDIQNKMNTLIDNVSVNITRSDSDIAI